MGKWYKSGQKCPPKCVGQNKCQGTHVRFFSSETRNQTNSGAYFMKQPDGWKAYQAENQKPRVLIPALQDCM